MVEIALLEILVRVLGSRLLPTGCWLVGWFIQRESDRYATPGVVYGTHPANRCSASSGGVGVYDIRGSVVAVARDALEEVGLPRRIEQFSVVLDSGKNMIS